MKNIRDYSSTLRGVTAYAIDSWVWLKSYQPRNDDERSWQAGQMAAFSRVIELATGRKIGTEEELVREVAAQV